MENVIGDIVDGGVKAAGRQVIFLIKLGGDGMTSWKRGRWRKASMATAVNRRLKFHTTKQWRTTAI